MALQQEAKTVSVSKPFSVDRSRVPPDEEAEFKKMQEVIASFKQELSALRPGHVMKSPCVGRTIRSALERSKPTLAKPTLAKVKILVFGS